MVNGNVPVLALRLALNVNVEGAEEVPETATGFGLKLALVPLGRLLTLRFTELEPLSAVTVTVVVLLEPRDTVSELGDADRLKSAVELLLPTVNEPIAVLHT